ncbi:MAG: hypothetical protein ACYCOU_05035 [Sulfobacillus sp.]
MSTPNNTLLLDTVAWDLVLDSDGNIALAQPPYAVAQDVASALRLYQGELWYDTTQGVPYQTLLSQNPTEAQIAAAFNQAALSVPGVIAANTVLTSSVGRKVSGQVSFTTADGTVMEVNF